MKQINNILIVDDNPFPTRETCKVLIEKFSKYCFVSDNNALLESFNQIYNSQYTDLVTDFPKIRGKELYLQFAENLTITIYNYDPTKPQSDNQIKILRILKDNNINIFWCDRGHSPFEIKGGSMYELDYGYNTKSDKLFENEDIVSQLIINNLKQVAVYTFNPELTEREAESRKDKIIKIFKSKLNINDIYIIETSSALNLFNKNDYLSSGKEKDNFLGTLKAYKLYGKLLGSILFDLFLQLKSNKIKLTSNQNRYNFFNSNNREILGYFKLLNSKNVTIIPTFQPDEKPRIDLDKDSGLNLGLISFYGNIFSQEYFLIDSPYKEYYQYYDDLLQKDTEKINSIFDFSIDNILNENSKDFKERWMYFKYKKSDSKFVFCHKTHNDLKDKDHLVEKYLPLLHTAIFYEPDFYEDKFPFTNFQKCNSEIIFSENDIDSIEIFYFFKKISLKGIDGYIHFAVWRRGTEKIFNLESLIDGFWENYYKLIEPKIEQTLIDIILKETLNQSIKAAIAQVMARNSSHNIGSHVLNNLTDGSTLSKITYYECKSYQPLSELKDLKEESKIINQLALFNNYVKCRMDYLADITFGTPVMHTNKKVYTELYKDFDRVRLLLDNISGLSKNFPFEIKFTLNGNAITTENDFCIALPNDLLGSQAFYNIIENVIRNTAKHNQTKLGTTIFTINLKEITDDLNKVADIELLYEVEIFDDIKITGEKIFTQNEIQIQQKYHQKTLTDKNVAVTKINWLVFCQNEQLNLSVLDEKHNNQLRNSSLGLLEMEASAAYLRKLDIANIEDDAFEVEYDNKFNNKHGSINILKAINKNGALGYRFFVSKPTEFLFVGDFNEITLGRYTELLKMGIWFRTADDFKKEVKKESGTVFNHQFIFHQSVQFIKDFEKEENRKYKTQLPFRIVELNKKTNCLLTLLRTKEVAFKKIEECVWQIWFDKIKGDYKVVNVFTSYQTKHCATNRYNIALLNHNDSWCQSKIDKAYNKVDYLEPLSSNAQKTLPYFKNKLTKYLDNDEWDELKMHKIFEAAISKILIIDERIQRFANTDYVADNVNAPIKEIFIDTNVFVPDYTIYPLDADNFKEDRVDNICNYIDEQVNNCNFMLIHFGILERMYKNEMNTIDSKLKEWATKTRVIVTSGRGKPKEHLPREVCYVNLSPVLNVFTQTRSKYAMNYLLNQSRQ